MKIQTVDTLVYPVDTLAHFVEALIHLREAVGYVFTAALVKVDQERDYGSKEHSNNHAECFNEW
ncbi:MAG: hypothetical protein F4Y75_02790 [Acidimicrobiia bacterium]|nr:hypothetical protein [bacterium]MXZ06433.1 hypothetical protein [Acidimicrobiia bacterium]MCY3579437.1 hypothetical protein [bacterium]MCY3652188.1 hypothetical protein [bacterium]MDE0642616.1 hypothetical protein [bacterium]